MHLLLLPHQFINFASTLAKICPLKRGSSSGVFCHSAKAHAFNVSYVRKSKLGSQHPGGFSTSGESAPARSHHHCGRVSTPRESALSLLLFFLVFRLSA